MKKNSATLFLESPNAITPVPWVDNAPDFSGFTEPTLSILQNAWQDFLGSGEELEIIPDPEPIQQLIPNWQGFYDSLIVSNIYNYLLSNTIPHPSISGVMAMMGFAIKFGIDDPSNPDRLDALQAFVSAVLYAINAVQLPLTEEMLIEIRTLLDDNGFQSIQLS